MIYFGFDPGVSGAIAWINSGVPHVVNMPDTAVGIRDVVLGWDTGAVRAVVEKVGAMPKQGVTSTFTFGRSYGRILGALEALGVPFELVTPQRWQKTLGCMTGGDKKVSQARAQQLFPGVKVTQKNADALLLAEYCRRLFGSMEAP